MAQGPAEPLGHVGIQIQLALFDQAHGADRDHQLGDRCDPHRVAGGQAALRGGIGDSVHLGRGDAVAVERDPGRCHRAGRLRRSQQAGQRGHHRDACEPCHRAFPVVIWMEG